MSEQIPEQVGPDAGAIDAAVVSPNASAEPAKLDAEPRLIAADHEAPKPDPVQPEAPKAQAAKPDAPNLEALKAEAPQPEREDQVIIDHGAAPPAHRFEHDRHGDAAPPVTRSGGHQASGELGDCSDQAGADLPRAPARAVSSSERKATRAPRRRRR